MAYNRILNYYKNTSYIYSNILSFELIDLQEAFQDEKSIILGIFC